MLLTMFIILARPNRSGGVYPSDAAGRADRHAQGRALTHSRVLGEQQAGQGAAGMWRADCFSKLSVFVNM